MAILPEFHSHFSIQCENPGESHYEIIMPKRIFPFHDIEKCLGSSSNLQTRLSLSRDFHSTLLTGDEWIRVMFFSPSISMDPLGLATVVAVGCITAGTSF